MAPAAGPEIHLQPVCLFITKTWSKFPKFSSLTICPVRCWLLALWLKLDHFSFKVLISFMYTLESYLHILGIAENDVVWIAMWLRICLPMQETRIWSLSQEDPLEEEMASHSSIPVWEIPWTEEPGGVQSMGSPRIGHNCMSTKVIQPGKLSICQIWCLPYTKLNNSVGFHKYLLCSRGQGIWTK